MEQRGLLDHEFMEEDEGHELTSGPRSKKDTILSSVLGKRFDWFIKNNQSYTPTQQGGNFFDRLVYNKEEEEEKEEEGKGLSSNYNDFDTIDWTRDAMIDRYQREKISKLENKGFNLIIKTYFRIQGWIYILLIAAAVGVLAAIIDIGVEWFWGLRFGYCAKHFWITPKLCCKETPLDECEDWQSWSDIFHVNNTAGSFVINQALYVVTAILYAGLAALFVKSFARYAAGSGIPEVKTILGGFVIKSFNSTQTLIVKIVGLILSVSSGLNLGKEGPMVHIATCCGEIFSRFFSKYANNEAKKREILSAAAAAGVSVAFGAPIGGVLFSLEEVSYYFPHKTLWRSFFCTTAAALVLQFMNPFQTGKLVIFQVKFQTNWHAFELPAFLLLGVLGGLMGAFFIKTNIRLYSLRKSTKWKRFPIQEAMVLAGITALISYLNVYTIGDSGELIGLLFNECAVSGDDPAAKELCNAESAMSNIINLFLACVIKLLLTIFTIGLKIPSGLYIPSLAIGACLGRAVGISMQEIQRIHPEWVLFNACKYSETCVSPGVYAMIGAVSVLGGVTRMTISLVVIMFEITGEAQFILPIMLSVMISKWVGDAFGADSIYDELIQLNEFPFLDNKTERSLKAKVSDILKRGELAVVELQGNTVRSLREFMENNKYTGYPVVTTKQDAQIVGYIARSDLRRALEKAKKNASYTENTRCYFSSDIPLAESSPFIDLCPYMNTSPIQITLSTPLNIVYDMFKKVGLRHVLVAHHSKLVGIVTKKDILQYIAITYHNKVRTFISSENKENEM
eukprot:TRINITY_DN1514_c0_g1_i1.p1 TRINITY_DN1514_c0_g1~~TRINITY_DN1514_c0_g1_i1.p1  ORF type:complete len:794 (+),score=111.19 TRINITY_DN1514_c0_g1_i1:42-2423(+)